MYLMNVYIYLNKLYINLPPTTPVIIPAVTCNNVWQCKYIREYPTRNK